MLPGKARSPPSCVGIHQYRAGGFISVHDATVLREIAAVICGGNLSVPQWVDEEYFLRLEREAFLRLLMNHKTQERIKHFLETGNTRIGGPLRGKYGQRSGNRCGGTDSGRQSATGYASRDAAG